MEKSHAVGRASPTPAQLKELFTQIDTGRVTKARLQAFLRNQPDDPTPEREREPVHIWMLRHGFFPAWYDKKAVDLKSLNESGWSGGELGFLRSVPDDRILALGKYRRPFVARLNFDLHKSNWDFQVLGVENIPEFQNLAKELEEIYGVTVKVELARKRALREVFLTSD